MRMLQTTARVGPRGGYVPVAIVEDATVPERLARFYFKGYLVGERSAADPPKRWDTAHIGPTLFHTLEMYLVVRKVVPNEPV